MGKIELNIYRISKPDDRLVKYAVNYTTNQTHNFLKLKGEYVEFCTNEYSKSTGELKIVDNSYIAQMPSGHRMIYNIEDETSKVNEETLNKIDEYSIQIRYKYNEKVNSVITTTLPLNKCLTELKISQTKTLHPLLRSYTEPDNYEKLNRIILKVKYKEMLSDDEAMELIFRARVCPEALYEVCDVFKASKLKILHLKYI